MAINLKTGVATTIIGVIIAIIIIFNILGSTSSTVTSSADSITQANNCSEDTGYTYDATGVCASDANTSINYTAGSYALPLAGLFGSGGVILFVFMAGILIMFVTIALKRRR